MSHLSRSQQPTGTPIAPVFHSALSRRLVQARAATPTPSSPASSSTATDDREDEHRSQVLPEGDFVLVGQRFEVDFEHVCLNSRRLTPARLGYKVKHKSVLKGRREGSPSSPPP
ncbi:hypothetical protein BDW02DRAFT_280594 [Decorospora gaudefroyi]|uniref:Uncharacterized protein n=1 Tax=Decorospora gaudefroyi TaxID=184978 RepID=A0A6A5JWG4_9PLEO|nr:hypothetical protein BDW02DRAFT_280594 [Decorospora gaudefroyi]